MSLSIKKEIDSLQLFLSYLIMNENETTNPWKTLSQEEKYDNRWIRVTEYQVINPGGGRGIYGKVHFKNKAVAVIPIDESGNTWLVGQYRYTLNAWSWEVPEGGCSEGEELLICARRELQEETGLVAQRWSLLTTLHTSNSVTDETGYIFLAEDLREGNSLPEESEADIKVMKLQLEEALEMVMTGRITDSMSMIGLLMVARSLKK